MRAVAREMRWRGGDVEDVVGRMVSVRPIVVRTITVLLLVLRLVMVIVWRCMRVGRALVGRVCRRRCHETGKFVT